MKILALDSSGLVASAAIVEDDILIAEYTLNYKKTHSQTLLPMLDEIRRNTELDLKTVDAVAVASGPGSFTGLRIGAATAKGLGFALEIPLVEVPTLKGLTYNVWGTDRLICPMMDARRSQVYTGIYQFETNGHEQELRTIEPQCAVDVTVILEEINDLKQEVIFLGDGVAVYREMIEAKTKVPYIIAPPHRSRQSAAGIAVLGARYFAAGKIVSAKTHQPEYLRLSQAERERLNL